ncbi:MAG TPA: preprotein translocase subunit SecA [Phycisphaerales bacterium]|nr:preprotein translocase subunit SecA [Phycisphaerales bacterium]
MSEQGIPIIGPILNKIIGTRNERFVKRYLQRVSAINALEPQARQLTDAEIRVKVADFRARADKGENPDSVMIEALAVAREAMDRAVGLRNIFNPRFAFDASQLPPRAREIYEAIKAQADSLPPVVPATFDPGEARRQPPENGVPDEKNDYLGFTEAVPGWMQVDIEPELYEAVRNIYPESRPPFRARPFDVQLIGGMVLCQGKISEMKTGEGKTIVAPLACCIAAIERLKVHVVTVNDYLVQRDRDWTAPYFRALGLTVGAIHPQHMQDEDAKRLMYRCDVVYGTTAEFGFDYLRDNMKRAVEQQVQKARQFAIVDEVDSILIDEARTPLIISGQAHDDQPRYELADRLARHLVEKQRPWAQADEEVTRCQLRIKGLEGDIRQARDKSQVPALQAALKEAQALLPKLKAQRDQHPQYFEVKPERKQCHLTHDGVGEAQRAAAIGSFYVDENIDLPHLLEQSLRAHTVYERDKDYIVREVNDMYTGRPTPSVIIVDQNTGRAMIGRQWSDGLHQAVECKERVPIKAETQTVASVTIQNFFKMYKRLAGMTGTADTEAQEFHDIYKLDVVAIPTNKPVRRSDFDDVVFLSQKDKWSAIVDEIKAFNDVGRPVLVGTTSVEKSENLSKLLASKHAINHEVLNAKQHEREAHIVENAGQLGAVMIATNMAGRGTDIKLGAITREKLLDHWLRRGIAPRTVTVESTEEQLREGVWRKIAPRELSAEKREAESMPAPELELKLLRHWAGKFTWMTPGEIEKTSAEDLRSALDANGRFLLHRLRWFESIEDMGGLHVIGTERHEARRIDNQLRGRSGRQGDKGSSRFFVSLEDDLMKLFAGETTMKILARLGMKEGDAIEHPMLSKRIQGAQKKVEERNFQIRKTVLEYDEVMEHQRQTFYGLRQQVLEGRGVRTLVVDFIRQTVAEAVDRYLDPIYPAECAAEFAKGALECSIAPDRLRGRDLAEMDRQIREEAAYETRQTIDMTLGEYMPMAGSDVTVDFDPSGLIAWAQSRFGVTLDPSRLSHGTDEERAYARDALLRQAEQAVMNADLSGLAEFTTPEYGETQLAAWVRDKLGFEVTVDEIKRAKKAATEEDQTPVTTMLMQRVEQWYHRREVEYPVEYGVQMFQMMMRQPGMTAADSARAFLQWANTRFGMGWTPELFRTSTLQTAQQQLLEAAKLAVDENRMEKEVRDAIATPDDDALADYWQKTFFRPLPEAMRHLKGQDRANAVRAGVENLRRPELLRFERTIVIETMDNLWRDHLYAMDQLRDTINFRAFSQNDPRIEYKREGTTMFREMMANARLRITELIFKARITPQMPPGAVPPPQAPRTAPPRPAPGQAPSFASGITGPGLTA